MICPHCGKEADGYVGIQTTEGSTPATGFCPNVVTSNKLDSGMFNSTHILNNANSTHILNNAAAASPVVATQGNGVLNMTGCANQGVLDIHYHMF